MPCSIYGVANGCRQSGIGDKSGMCPDVLALISSGPMLYVNMGMMNNMYNRRCSCREICDHLNHTVYSLQKATLVNRFRQATSSASLRSDPSLHVILHSSSMQSACRLTLVCSVFVVLIMNDHSAKHACAMRSISSRNERDELIKSFLAYQI